MARREGTGTWPDYMVNRADKKNRGHSGKILARKSRNSCNVNGQGYGYIEANLRNPRSKYKRSKNVFAVTSIALSLSHLAPRLLQLLAQSLLQNMVSFIGLFCKRDLSMSCLKEPHWGIVEASCAVCNRESRYPQLGVLWMPLRTLFFDI